MPDHGGDPAEGEKVKAQFYFRPSHADLVLMTIGKDGLTGQSAAALAARIEQAAATLGAPFQTPDALRAEAEQQVAEVVARVNATNQAGGLREWNTKYKRYRLAQIARAEAAIPYSKFIEQYTAIIIARVAASGRMICA